jgi:hypothetical protein
VCLGGLRSCSNILSKNKKPRRLCPGLYITKLVAGARYVPNTQFLSIPFRSELIHSAA